MVVLARKILFQLRLEFHMASFGHFAADSGRLSHDKNSGPMIWGWNKID